jgi:hypothetical protein
MRANYLFLSSIVQKKKLFGQSRKIDETIVGLSREMFFVFVFQREIFYHFFSFFFSGTKTNTVNKLAQHKYKGVEVICSSKLSSPHLSNFLNGARNNW